MDFDGKPPGFPYIYFRPTDRAGKQLVKNNNVKRSGKQGKQHNLHRFPVFFCKFPIFTTYMIPHSVTKVNTYFSFFGIILPVVCRLGKLEFVELMIAVTFLCPNKKVTKEVVRGEALRANRTLAPDPTPAATTTVH